MLAIPASLHSLLFNLIDCADNYPPAALPVRDVVEKYAAYRASPYSWMLNRLVLPTAKLAEAWWARAGESLCWSMGSRALCRPKWKRWKPS